MSGVAGQSIRARYDAVCAELNMDEPTAKKAWTSYEETNNDYVLEVSYDKKRRIKRLCI